jgi:DNA-binding PadR family transcriptional regulator
MGMKVSGVNLDRLAQEVLAAIDASEDGVLDTAEVKTDVKADGNKKVKYRFDKLEEGGMIEVKTDRKDGNTSLPNRATITEAGKELVESYELEFGDADDPTETLRERVERSERERARVKEDLENLQRMLGLLLKELNVDKSRVEAFDIDPEDLGLGDGGGAG